MSNTAINVEFPKLGINIPVDKVAFRLGGFEIYWYGLLIGLALGIGVYLAIRSAKKHNISRDLIIDVVLYGMIAAVIGARLYYIVFSKDFKFNSFVDIVNLRSGGLAIYGGIIGAVISTIIVSKLHKISFWKTMDFLVPYLALGQAIGRWGNFFNQEAFGSNTNLPWGMKSQATIDFLNQKVEEGAMYDPAAAVHPTFLYESVLCFSLFLILISIRNNYHKRGMVFAVYLAVYGFGRALIEKLRTDSLETLGQIKVSELLGLASAVAAVVGIAYLVKYGVKKDPEEEVPLLVEDVDEAEGEIY